MTVTAETPSNCIGEVRFVFNNKQAHAEKLDTVG